MSDRNWEPKVGDKVCCVETSYSTSEISSVVKVGEIYTVRDIEYGVAGAPHSKRWRIKLVGIDSDNFEIPFFRTEDFELVERDTPEDAWDRAMRLL